MADFIFSRAIQDARRAGDSGRGRMVGEIGAQCYYVTWSRSHEGPLV